VALREESSDFVHGGTQKKTYSPDEVFDVSCPLCSSEKRRRIYTELGSVGISQCLSCSLIYTSPRTREPEKVYWGDAEAIYEEARLIFDGKAAHHRDPNYLHEMKTIERFKKKGRLLDVGCNIGMILRHAAKRGWDVVGVEPSPPQANLCTKFGFKVYNCFLNELPASEVGLFDVVSFSDVFEHVTEPISFLEQAGRFLQPDGILFVKVPNMKWSMLKQRIISLAGRHPAQGIWGSYEHVVHYSDKTLTAMLHRGGFELVRLGIDPPVQIPTWHEYVGRYYQYPTPLCMDWRRKLGRYASYRLSGVERWLRLGSVGYLAPNLVAVAKKR
jgi:SAM-dependent methyltransferase